MNTVNTMVKLEEDCMTEGKKHMRPIKPNYSSNNKNLSVVGI